MWDENTGYRLIPIQRRSLTRIFDVVLAIGLNKLLNKQLGSCDATIMISTIIFYITLPSFPLLPCFLPYEPPRLKQIKSNATYMWNYQELMHDDVIKWKHFPRNWPFVREFTGPGEFPTRRPVTRSFGVFFDLRLNKRLNKQPWGWWFDTLSWSLWRHCNGMAVITGLDIIHRNKDNHCIAWIVFPFPLLFVCVQESVFSGFETLRQSRFFWYFFFHPNCWEKFTIQFRKLILKQIIRLLGVCGSVKFVTVYHANVMKNLPYSGGNKTLCICKYRHLTFAFAWNVNSGKLIRHTCDEYPLQGISCVSWVIISKLQE